MTHLPSDDPSPLYESHDSDSEPPRRSTAKFELGADAKAPETLRLKTLTVTLIYHDNASLARDAERDAASVIRATLAGIRKTGAYVPRNMAGVAVSYSAATDERPTPDPKER